MIAPQQQPSLYEQWKASQTPKPTAPKSLYSEWRKDKPDVSPDDGGPDARGYGGRLVSTFLKAAQGVPGMERFEAAAGAVGSHLPWSDSPMTYGESLRALREQADQVPHQTAVKMLGGGAMVAGVASVIPAFGALSIPAQGAIVGGADQLGSADEMGYGARAVRTAGGAGAGWVGVHVLKGAGNAVAWTGKQIGNKTGITAKIQPAIDAITSARFPNKTFDIRNPRAGFTDIAPTASLSDMGQASGVKGAANTVLKGRQDILDRLAGSEKSAATAVAEQAAQTHAQAKALYDAARADDRLLSDPKVLAVLDDPRVRQIFEVARGRTGGVPNETVIQPARAVPGTPDVKADLPTPEDLHNAKRILASVVAQKFGAPTGINPVEATMMARKLDALREALHTASPAYRQADAFYAQAKTFENAYQKGYGASASPTATALQPSKLRTPEALRAWIDKARGTPTGIARASGVQAGTAGQVAKQIEAQPIGSNVADVLNAPALRSSPAAAKGRRAAFGSDDESRQFAELLGSIGKRGAEDAAARAPKSYTVKGVGYTRPARTVPLETPEGVALRARLAEELSTPGGAATIRGRIAGAERGQSLKDILAAMLLGGAYGAVKR